MISAMLHTAHTSGHIQIISAMLQTVSTPGDLIIIHHSGAHHDRHIQYTVCFSWQLD